MGRGSHGMVGSVAIVQLCQVLEVKIGYYPCFALFHVVVLGSSRVQGCPDPGLSRVIQKPGSRVVQGPGSYRVQMLFGTSSAFFKLDGFIDHLRTQGGFFSERCHQYISFPFVSPFICTC